MDITFNCKGCGQHIAIDEAGAGVSVQCPNCNQSLVVPNASTTNVTRIPLGENMVAIDGEKYDLNVLKAFRDGLRSPLVFVSLNSEASAQIDPTIDPTAVYTLFRGRGPAKPTQIFDAEYFYRTSEKKTKGPFNKLEMRALIRKKVVELETMVLCPVTQEWVPCERFPELPKPAYNKLLHFEKDVRFSMLVQEIPKKIVDHITNKMSEPELKEWLVKRIQECGYKCPDYDEGTINDLVYEDRLKVIISKKQADLVWLSSVCPTRRFYTNKQASSYWILMNLKIS